MDLSNIVQKDIIPVEIYHPVTGEKTDIVIYVHTTYSKKYKNLVHAQRNKRLYDRRKKITSEQTEAEAMEIIAKCTDSWDNMVENGVDLECNPENAMKVYKKHQWIFDQIDVEMNNQTNFLEDAPTN